MRRAAAAVAIAVLAVLVTATPASAHNYVVSSTPAAGETLTQLPDRFIVTTNDALLDLSGSGSSFGLEIVDADGLYYGDGCVTIDGPSITAEPVIGAAGTYTLIYQVVSADGHTVSDEFEFEWAPPGDFVASAGSGKPGDCNGLYARGDTPPDAQQPSASVDLSTLLWIGGAVGAVLVAVVVTLLVLRPKKK